MSQRRQHSSSRSARAAPAGDVLLSPARQTRSSSRLADSSDPPVTRSKTSQSSTLSRSSRLARHNSAPAKSLVPAKSAVPAAKTRDALRDPAATPVRRKSAQRRSPYGSAPPEFRPSLDPVPEASLESSPGPSFPPHAENGAVSGPLDGREANSPKGVRQLDFAATGDTGNDSDHGGSSSADHANFLYHLLEEADHNDDGLALSPPIPPPPQYSPDASPENGARCRDISSPATLCDLCEQESFSLPTSGPGNERPDARMMVDAMEPSRRLSRGKGMRESGPCSSPRAVSYTHLRAHET